MYCWGGQVDICGTNLHLRDNVQRATAGEYDQRQNGAPRSAQRAMTHASQIQKFLFSASPVIYRTSFFFSILEKKEFFSKLNKLCSHLINSIIMENQNVRNRIVRRYTIEEKWAVIRYKDNLGQLAKS